MSDAAIFMTNPLLEDETLQPESMLLDPADVDQAIALSHQVPASRQWQTYLQALACFGFAQWLGDRAPRLAHSLVSDVLNSVVARATSGIEVGCHFTIGEFRLCLLVAGSVTDEQVTVPRAVLELPELAAHFYVLVEVVEEEEQVTLQGFLRYDQGLQQLQTASLPPDRDWTYSLPRAWFDDNLDTLLLYLRCLEPAAIALPEVVARSSGTLSTLQTDLSNALPALQDPTRSLWQVLTWEQGAMVLTNPELVNWLARVQTTAPELGAVQSSPDVADPEGPVSAVVYLQDLLHLIMQPAINAALWLRDEVDTVAQSLAWSLLPPLATASALRSSTQELEAIATELQRADLDIPHYARMAYQDVDLAGVRLRLHAAIWPLSEDVPEWTLLLILGPQPGTTLRQPIRLRISDQQDILVQRVLYPDRAVTYIYSSVIGEWHEKFIATLVNLATGASLTLPPIAFAPNPAS